MIIKKGITMAPTATTLPPIFRPPGRDMSALRAQLPVIDPHDAYLAPAVNFRCHKMSPSTDRIMLSLSQPDGISVFLQSCITKVVKTLYPHDTAPRSIRCISFFLDHMDGVAHTISSDQSDHKEIHLSIQYFSSQPPSQLHSELEGVLVHEIVHCYQHTAEQTAPGGFIEGMADFVRLYNNLAPPHWDRTSKGDKWDAGYQHTAYFLAWLDTQFQSGNAQVARSLNEGCKTGKWSDSIFEDVTGEKIEQLWTLYLTSDHK